MTELTKSNSEQLTIQLTDDYRLVSDGMQYVLQRHVTVDPAAAPNWAARVAEATAKGDPTPDATIRHAWRNVDAPYFSLTDAGLIAAINSLKHRIAADRLGSVSLSEFAEFLRKQTDEMTARVSGQNP